ncbi:DUF6127 family protein [Qipengyuania sp. JC766]|uniref:DUF6127 family protein n=1 Tax=Qipengyuania sp. JC766 TaxID=3232139 RepID=UPI0034579BB6
MSEDDMLARLIAQARAEGTELMTLRAIVEESSAIGATRALVRLGLEDDDARGDMAELRELLGGWREAKAGAWKAAVEWLVRAGFALLLVGIAVRIGMTDLLR